MRLYPYNNIGEKRVLFTPQFFDPEELRILKGAHRRGLHLRRYRRQYRRLFPCRRPRSRARPPASWRSSRIRTCSTVSPTISRLNPFGTIKATACAIADKPGELTLFLDPRNSGRVERQDRRRQPGDDPGARHDAAAARAQRASRAPRRDQARRGRRRGPDPRALSSATRRPSLYPSPSFIEHAASWQTDLLGLLTAHGYRLRGRRA